MHDCFEEKNNGASGDVKNADDDKIIKTNDEERKIARVLDSEQDMYLQVVPVILKAPGGRKVNTFALLDSGSHATFVRSDLASKLKLEGIKRSVNINTINERASELTVKEVGLDIISVDGKHCFPIRNALSISKQNFHMPAQKLPAGYNDPEI